MNQQEKLLDSWIQTAIETPLNVLKGRGKIVGRIKYILGLMVAVLAFSLVLWPLLYPVDAPLKITFSSVETAANQSTKMLNPRFKGIDKYNRPFHLQAVEAYQKTPEIVIVSRIQGDLMVSKESWLMIKADQGEVSIPGKSLKLNGNVELFSGDGYQVSSPYAEVDLNQSHAMGDKGISVQGPYGHLRANKFFIDANNSSIKMNDNVRVTLYPKER